jgi:effector-binding domain-containing protein
MVKRKILAFGIALLFLGWPTVRAGAGQEAPFSIKEVPAFAYCCIPQKGPFTEMGDVIGLLMKEMQDQSLFSTIEGPMISVFYGSPGEGQSQDLSWEVGFTVTPQATPQAPLIKKVWEHKTVAAALYTGPYANIGETIRRLTDWAKGQGYAASGPVLERYLNNPMEAKPEELRTEIWVAVEKKPATSETCTPTTAP